MTKTKRTLPVLIAAALCGGTLSAADVQVLRDSGGRELGTMEQSEHRAVMRDTSGRLIWWHCEQPPEIRPSVALPQNDKEENVLITILKLPIVAVCTVLCLSFALVKAVHL